MGGKRFFGRREIGLWYQFHWCYACSSGERINFLDATLTSYRSGENEMQACTNEEFYKNLFLLAWKNLLWDPWFFFLLKLSFSAAWRNHCQFLTSLSSISTQPNPPVVFYFYKNSVCKMFYSLWCSTYMYEFLHKFVTYLNFKRS